MSEERLPTFQDNEPSFHSTPWAEWIVLGAKRERERIAAAIDERIDAGRGVAECYAEAQTLDWVKRNIVGVTA